MRLRWQGVALVVCGVLLHGCSATRGKPFDPGLVGRQFYLCCHMAFNPRFEASDSNYGRYMAERRVYIAGPELEAGTRITVVAVGQSGIAFRPDGSDRTYTLTFGYGRDVLSPSAYFQGILRETNPMDSVQGVPKVIEAGIRQGRLVRGMTKDQTLLARGYPPAHRTPNLELDEWIYYDTPGFIDRVAFVDGKIESITRGPAN